MNIAVCVKQVLDATVPLRVVNGIMQQDAPWPIAHVSVAERAALEKALALRAQLRGAVTAISVGEADAVAALRFCLARGADRAVHLGRADALDPVGAATAVTAALAGEVIDLVLCGDASGDGASGVFAAVLAARLDWPLVTAVAALSAEPERELTIERRLERGDREVVRCPLPAVLAVEPSLAEAQYVSVRAQRAAQTAPIEVIACAGASATACELIALEPARPRPKRGSGPAAGLSTMDRLAHALSGGMQPKQGGGFVEGTPDAVVAQIVRFLKEKGFIRAREGRPNG